MPERRRSLCGGCLGDKSAVNIDGGNGRTQHNVETVEFAHHAVDSVGARQKYAMPSVLVRLASSCEYICASSNR